MTEQQRHPRGRHGELCGALGSWLWWGCDRPLLSSRLFPGTDVGSVLSAITHWLQTYAFRSIIWGWSGACFGTATAILKMPI